MIGLFLLSYPNTHYVVEGIRGTIAFTIAPSMVERVIVLCLLGVMMAFGMAAVFKHIPSYYPDHVGAVGGVVGMIGGDRKSTRLNSSHSCEPRMPSSA